MAVAVFAGQNDITGTVEFIEKRGGISGELARNIVTDQELSDLRRLGIVKSAVEVWEYLAVSHPR